MNSSAQLCWGLGPGIGVTLHDAKKGIAILTSQELLGFLFVILLSLSVVKQ